jgi:hypothetical protein
MRALAWLGRMAEKAVAPLVGRPRRAAAKADESDA